MQRTLEEWLVELCAPTLAGVKPANLFHCTDSPELFHSIYEWNERLRGSGLRIRASFVITKYKGLDPEVANAADKTFGIDKNVYPRPLVGILGVSLNF